MNAIVDGYDSAVEHFTTKLGATLNLDIPDDGEVKACLICLGGVIFELFAPHDRNAERGQGRLLGKFGDHYIGAEYVVPDVAVARQQCEEMGIRIIRDDGDVIFTYPGQFHGISFELWHTDWHDHIAPGGEFLDRTDPEASGRATALPTQEFWIDEHPMALTGLVRVSTAVEDLDGALANFARVIGAKELYRADRPAAAATAAGVGLGDTVFELMAPTGPGPVRDYLDRYGERIRSTVFGTTDLDKVRTHLASVGIEAVAGDADGTLAIPVNQNHGLLFEFSEEPATHPW